MKKPLIFTLAVLLALLPLATSCSQGTESETEERTLPPEPATYAEEEPLPETLPAEARGNALFSDIPVGNEADFAYTCGENGATVTGYQGSATVLALPLTLGGKPVTAIADGAFADNRTLTVLSLPDSVSSIGTNILKGCSSLQALRTPLLGADAASAQYLGYLFGADKYENNPRDIPVSLQFLSLTAMKELPAFALFECDDLLGVFLAPSVTSVGKFAFYACTRLQFVNTDSLGTVGDYAFDGCVSLTRARFSASLSKIGLGALRGCSALRELTLPFIGGSVSENRYLGYVFGAETVEFSAGYYPASLPSVVLADGCTAIPDHAFYRFASLRSVVIPASVISVGVRAFDGCTSLGSLIFPDGLETIGDNACFGCTSLTELSLGKSLTRMGINAFYRCWNLGSVTLPDTLKELPASAFADCLRLTSLDLGDVDSVGVNAFRNCYSLAYVSGNFSKVRFSEGNECVTSIFHEPE